MSEAMWRALAEKALGRDDVEALVSHTAEGLRIEPLYPRCRTDLPRAFRSGDRAWTIVQTMDHPDAREANRLALLDLEGGAGALALVFSGGTARGFGLSLDRESVATALDGVELDFIALRIDAGARTLEAAHRLAAIVASRRLASAALRIDLGYDPIGYFARRGIVFSEDPATGALVRPHELGALVALARDSGLAGRPLLADARPYHEAGAGEAQELAALLATGVAYLRHLEETGLTLMAARDTIAFLLVADADIYLTIAKFRALRRLWARVESACRLDPKPLRLHAETAWRMMTQRDPWANVMRATAAVFAAGVGGADTIAALPFTLACGLPEDAARRLARNTQLVLLDEAHLAEVADPAAGSGSLEALTEGLCARAWSLFQAIERDGGIEASLLSGTLQARVAETASRRRRNFATLDRAITGTSRFPPTARISDKPAESIRRFEPPHGPRALPTTRDAEPFEALCARAAARAAEGRMPTVVLVTLGAPEAAERQKTMMEALFAVAAIATVSRDIDGGPEADRDPMPVVCLCVGEGLDRADLADALQALRAAGARHIMVAGVSQPGDAIQGMDVDLVIEPGNDVLQMLTAVLDHVSDRGAAA